MEITIDEAISRWSPQLVLREWWQVLADAGLAFPGWPSGLGGRGLSSGEAADVTKALGRALGKANLIGPPPGLGTLMGGPVVAQFGTPEQQQRLLPALANGTEGWCQLFSEPGAGSDLAAVSTNAVRDGDEWVISGQKVWTSGAADSRRGMLIARTDWDQPKHRGITYFIIDLDQPGVDVRPLRQMNHRSHFSEVFLNEARVHDCDRISDVNNGWAVAVATLGYERSGLSAHGSGAIRIHPGESLGNVNRTVGELVTEHLGADEPEDESAPGGYSVLVGLAAELGKRNEPVIRDQLTRLYVHERIAAMTQQRSAAARRAGHAPGPESSTAKLWWTEGLRLARDLALQITGPWGTLLGEDTPSRGQVQTFALSVPAASIAGGSDEVQRNIIGERVLGLPKDLVVDADIAFRDVRRS
jgi:alkylation response protein AidB-like acyl-CoA dehydrogenase